ncbi:inositol polyphosphate-5-phosphatase A [Leptopilina heterotoma]|uniref:inositol polyphosphate-5-phosphatase A n=1 Tax=Leptopilina heterotoma TaxID=63436 RepID=UPI001CA99A52|nr:inositol polyphosphate-5-phosphatase A [Leptopilina heterotoma]
MAGLPVVLITANVGSIFEEPKNMLKIWTEEFLSTITRLDPKFIALHCQEVGGKNYEQSMRHVEEFVRLLMSSEELRLFDKVRVYLDEDFSSPEHFTALGNFYFVHDSLKDVFLWDFKDGEFLPVNGKEVHSGNIETVSTKEKAKFPQDFFPECKWSRKGFLRTRWSISGTIFDLINIHLFHDASNFIAMETFPSVYSKTRRRALEHTLERFHNDQYPNAPYFVFGDFNFRTDTASVIKKLTEDTRESKTSAKGSISKMQFRNNDDSVVLTLGKKEFSHYKHQNVFIENEGQWLKEYDKELDDFNGRLFEFPIKFIPSYPFEEDIQEGANYMQTRVPAWCDRILLSSTAKQLVQNIQPNDVEYGIIGPTKCMGDHKPVYLKVNLALNAGMINCCNLQNIAQFCFRVPDNYLDLVSLLPVSRSCAKSFATDRSSNFLHATPIKHDPYTPDSMESPSPNTMAAVGYTPNLELESSEKSVSPALLKLKLEEIAMIATQEAVDSEQEIEITNDLRRNRSNSDVSWQKKKPCEGDSDHGFHSYDNIFSKSNALLELENREIPQIKIINASNMVSNESCCTEHARTKSESVEGSLDEKVDGRSQQTTNEILVSHINSFTINDIPYNDESYKVKIKIDKSTQTEKATYIENGNDQSANPLPLSEQPLKTKRKRRRRIHDPNMTHEESDGEVENLNTNQDSTKQTRKLKLKKNCKRVNDKSRRDTFIEKERKRCCVIS